MSFLGSAYLAASHVTGPLFRLAQLRALARGKEDPVRQGERWGRTELARPAGPLVWFHGASVGETQSILPLIKALLEAHDGLTVLVTSTTRTSAEMLARDLPPRALHQMAPYDTVRATRAFLDHWQPVVAVFVESELWPRMLKEAQRRDIPRLLINARVSARTAARWARVAGTARALLGQFSEIHVQEEGTLQAIRSVGVTSDHVRLTGALKQDRPALTCDEVELDRLRNVIGDRPVWCAASTHPGEDEAVLDAHKSVGGLLILVPRHAERAGEIAALCEERGLTCTRRSTGGDPGPEIRVYIADTMGEMGLWYRLAPVSFVGGSLAEIGGHNPYEPALLGSAILFGPHVGNFRQVYDRLVAVGGAIEVDAESLPGQVRSLLNDGAAAMTAAAREVAQDGQGATAAALAAIEAHLPG